MDDKKTFLKMKFEIILGIFILVVLLAFATIFYYYAINYKSQSTIQIISEIESSDIQSESDYILSELNSSSQISEFSSESQSSKSSKSSHISSASISTNTETKNSDFKAYLTFDDGPSQNTVSILNTLKENNIKATFFITGPKSDFKTSTIKRIFNEGHEIAIHCYSHSYKSLYTTHEGYFNDFNKIENYVMDITHVKPTIYRFPGGTNHASKGFLQSVIAELKGRGYTYSDWNVSSGDANPHALSKEAIKNNVINQCRDKKRANIKKSVILMHDSSSKKATADALPEIINGLKDMGFSFDVMSKESVVQFKPR